MTRGYWLFLVCGLPTLFGQAQNPYGTTEHPVHMATEPTGHLIQPNALAAFWQKLDGLRRGESQHIHIAHIGDSHVQADYLPRTIRKAFWKDFGRAGRGLVFPYGLAETHGPLDYTWQSDQAWIYRRRTFQRNGVPIGLSGMGLMAAGRKAELTFFAQPDSGILCDEILLFGDSLTQWFGYSGDSPNPPLLSANWQIHQVAAGETLYQLSKQYQCTVQELQAWNNLTGPTIYVGQQLRVGRTPLGADHLPEYRPFAATPIANVFHLSLAEPAEQIGLRARASANHRPTFYGMQLTRRAQSGIVYHMIGVNGTTYYHYNRSALFHQQLRALAPDLIILTLGTNEALQQRFLEAPIRQEVEAFLAQLQRDHPDAGILVMTNPAVGNANGDRMVQPGQMANILRNIALDKGVACFDWYALMGEAEGVYHWRAAELVYKDYIHFTKKGYIFLGNLLYEALMRAYHDRN